MCVCGVTLEGVKVVVLSGPFFSSYLVAGCVFGGVQSILRLTVRRLLRSGDKYNLHSAHFSHYFAYTSLLLQRFPSLLRSEADITLMTITI